LFHIKEITQPQGHSTSGSHERYKSKERLEWEREFDCNKKMREWMIRYAIVTEDECVAIEEEAKEFTQQERRTAWENFNDPIQNSISELTGILREVAEVSEYADEISALQSSIQSVT